MAIQTKAFSIVCVLSDLVNFKIQRSQHKQYFFSFFFALENKDFVLSKMKIIEPGCGTANKYSVNLKIFILWHLMLVTRLCYNSSSVKFLFLIHIFTFFIFFLFSVHTNSLFVFHIHDCYIYSCMQFYDERVGRKTRFKLPSRSLLLTYHSFHYTQT